jgi:hypothetical protein
MEHQGDSTGRPVAASLKATYRALLARGLEAGQAANLTAFVHGLSSAGFHWTLPEVEAILRRRLEYAAELRAATARPLRSSAVVPRSSIQDRRRSRSSTTHVIDSPKP